MFGMLANELPEHSAMLTVFFKWPLVVLQLEFSLIITEISVKVSYNFSCVEFLIY